jgi:hypothetical protein
MAKSKLILFHSGHENDLIMEEAYTILFRAQGIEVVALNGASAESAHNLLAVVENSPNDFIAVVGMGAYIFRFFDSKVPAIHRTLNVPLVIFVMDHPGYCMTEMPEGIEDALYVTGCEDHEAYWRKHRPLDKNVITLKNFAWANTSESLSPDLESFLKRDPIIFAPVNLSMAGLSTEDWWAYVDQQPEPVLSVIKDAFEAVVHNQYMGVDEAIEKILLDRSVELEVLQRIEASRCVDGLTKMWRRNFVIGSLIDLPIIVSTDYVPKQFLQKHADKFIQTLGYKTVELMSQVQILINIPPPRPKMVHDRIGKCIDAGAALLTESTVGIREYLEEDRDFIGYEYDVDSLRETAAQALNNPADLYEMTISAKKHWDGKIEKESTVTVLLEAIADVRNAN